VIAVHVLVCVCTQGDVFGCVADVGWVTGHTYAVYGPLLLGIHIDIALNQLSYQF
jgi:acyl-coenzyme A synthetase/AMP-(fatty) acid ligase